MWETSKKHFLALIEQALEEIRPFLQKDGGDIRVVDLKKDGVVIVELLGNCKECEMKGDTLQGGIEQIIKQRLPFIKKVKLLE